MPNAQTESRVNRRHLQQQLEFCHLQTQAGEDGEKINHRKSPILVLTWRIKIKCSLQTLDLELKCDTPWPQYIELMHIFAWTVGLHCVVAFNQDEGYLLYLWKLSCLSQTFTFVPKVLWHYLNVTYFFPTLPSHDIYLTPPSWGYFNFEFMLWLHSAALSNYRSF